MSYNTLRLLVVVVQLATRNVTAFAPLTPFLSSSSTQPACRNVPTIECSPSSFSFKFRKLTTLGSTSSSTNETDDLMLMTVPELKEMLRELGLKVGGKKSELVDRILEAKSISIATDTDTDEVEEEQEEQETTNEKEHANPIIVPAPIDGNFESLGLASFLKGPIASQGWETPTPIQSLAIPEILKSFSPISSTGGSQGEGEGGEGSALSLWAEAPTGSGKTGTFALSLLQLIAELKKQNRGFTAADSDGGGNVVGVTSLILCPTRELAVQIGGVMEELVEGVDLPEDVSVEVITGGVPLEPQVSALARRQQSNQNLDILIATPGRLADVLLRSTKEDSTEKELESKLLAALDSVNDGNDVSLSLAQLDNFKINESIASGDDGGRSAIKDILSTVRFLVIDEADRLLSQGFKKEVDNVLNLLPRPNGSNDPEGMKTLLFSATFPEQIQPRVEKVLQRLGGKDAPSPLRLSCTNVGVANLEPEQLSGRQQKRLALTTQPQTILEGPASTIKLRSIRLDEQDRTQALRRLLREYGSEEWDRVLVFVGTRYSAEHVAMKLRRYNIKAAELHGKLDQDARTRRLNDFRKGKIQVLVATDLASRGLDVAGLAAVVNYDLPRSTTDFTQRIGRTGRAGNHGTAVSFITPSNEFQYDLIEKRHLNGIEKVEREVLKGFEPNESKWEIISASKKTSVSGTEHSKDGLAHDQMFGGIKGRRKSKKDKLREKAAREAAKKASLN